MTIRLSRRRFLAATSALGLGSLTGPKVLAAENGAVDLVAQPVSHSLVGESGPASDLWGYNGAVPGPVLRMRRGETMTVRFRNELDVPSSVHWHGIRGINAMDGVAGLTQDPVPPGESFEYQVKAPDAGTYWYHAHTNSWDQVVRGLYGALIVDEPQPAFPPEADIVLILDDWRVDGEGRFDTASLGNMMDWSHGGRLGNILTVNGVTQPDIPVPSGAWLRLRLVNACNARILAIDPARIGATVIALDGQPVDPGAAATNAPIPFAPAQRMDLLVRFDKTGSVALEEVSGSPFVFTTLDVGSGTGADAAAPILPGNAIPAPDLQNAKAFDLVMEGGAMGQMGQLVYNGRVQTRVDFMQNGQVWGFNGVANMTPDPLFSVGRNETVAITIDNRTAFAHAMHTHGHHFRIVERNGTAVDEPAWRDTFLSVPGEVTRIAFVADNPGKWLFHCHMLEHAAAGMTTWFEVT